MIEQETYTVTIFCNNCLQTQEFEIPKGKSRPDEFVCENCRCKSDTKHICS